MTSEEKARLFAARVLETGERTGRAIVAASTTPFGVNLAKVIYLLDVVTRENERLTNITLRGYLA